MINNDIELKLRKVIIDTLGEELSLEHIGLEDKFEEVGINSINFIKTVIMIEIAFDIEFEDEDLDVNNFINLKSLTEHLQSKLNTTV